MFASPSIADNFVHDIHVLMKQEDTQTNVTENQFLNVGVHSYQNSLTQKLRLFASSRMS